MRDRDNNSFNKPVRQAGYRNHFLRMSRTEPRSRCPLVPRQSPHLRKPRKHLLALLTLLTPPARTGVNTTEMRDHIDQVIKGTNVFATTASIHAHRKRPECVSKAIGQTNGTGTASSLGIHHPTAVQEENYNTQDLLSPRSRHNLPWKLPEISEH